MEKTENKIDKLKAELAEMKKKSTRARIDRDYRQLSLIQTEISSLNKQIYKAISELAVEKQKEYIKK